MLMTCFGSLPSLVYFRWYSSLAVKLMQTHSLPTTDTTHLGGGPGSHHSTGLYAATVQP